MCLIGVYIQCAFGFGIFNKHKGQKLSEVGSVNNPSSGLQVLWGHVYHRWMIGVEKRASVVSLCCIVTLQFQ